jgi:hypothetical protein
MASYADIEKARKRLKAARASTALFLEQHKNRKWSQKEAAEHRSLITAELNATIHLSDTEIDGPQGRVKR